MTFESMDAGAEMILQCERVASVVRPKLDDGLDRFLIHVPDKTGMEIVLDSVIAVEDFHS